MIRGEKNQRKEIKDIKELKIHEKKIWWMQGLKRNYLHWLSSRESGVGEHCYYHLYTDAKGSRNNVGLKD